jgi:hypothetical protein
VREREDIEERLRSALRAVAELPSPATTSPKPTRYRRTPGGQHPRLLAAVVSLAAVAAVVALVAVYGPRNGGKAVTHTPVPATQPHTSSPPPSTPPTTPTTLPPPTTTTVPSAAVGTQQITYEPFLGGEVDPSLHVTSQQSGPCFEYGGGADGRIYYRCDGTPIVTQPCFAGPQGTSAPLVCPQGLVTSNDVILWTATSVNTTSFLPATTKTPWVMELSNGMVCEFVNAAWSGLGPYGCSTPGITTPADCHQPQAATPNWTAACQDQESDASPFASITVEKVWF